MNRRKAAQDPVGANRRLWDARTPIHARSAFYDVDGFRAGGSSLHALEVDEVVAAAGGSLEGSSMLHLQCHFGLDTLSWARDHGLATAVGVDYSAAAVDTASRLAIECGLDGVAAFVESDVRTLSLVERFEIVFVSYGALCWLPSLADWAGVVASHLAPGGFAYVAELHPAAMTFNDEPGVSEMVVGYPYWTSPDAPLSFLEAGTYADVDADIELPEFVWNHGLADVVGSLLSAGLVLESLREHPFTMYPQLPFLEQSPDDGWWRLPEGMPAFPLLFSLVARKPA